MNTIKEIFATMDYGPAPESATPALDWIKRHDGKFHPFIDGQFVAPAADEYLETNNPATGETLGRVAQCSEPEVNAAVEAARRAYSQWSGLTGHARARYLYAVARQLQKHARLFAVLETLDNGKPIRETRDLDVPLAIRHFYHHAGWAQLIEGELPGYEPLGVCAQVIPWNFPLLMLAWKIAPALAAGNTVVLKPAEYTPLTALLFAEITREIGLPPGVVNIVTGDGRTGEKLVNHPDVNKVAFTGSTEVGKLIRQSTAGSGKKLSLELGGKSPFIVFEDSDLDSVVEGVVDAIWFNQGQVCCAGSRLLVQEGIAQRLYTKLQARMENLRVADPLDKVCDMGAIVAPVQWQKIARIVAEAKADGATCWQPSWDVPGNGLFFPPTLFTDVEPASTLAQVEIFGPVMVAMTFRTPAEAVELANNTPYGLAASVWTENINLALDVAPQLQAGVVWINCTNQFDAAAGFGGYRESGYGREGGREGLFEYLQPGWEKSLPSYEPTAVMEAPARHGHTAAGVPGLPPIDRTPKLFIGGKQVRPDGGYSDPVFGREGGRLAEVGQGNRKDIRNAVEAARKASGWTRSTAHNRAQILYYLAENLAGRADEFRGRLRSLAGADEREVELAIERLFYYAAWADKHDGQVHRAPIRAVTLAMPEPWQVMGLLCPDEAPLLALVSLVAPAIAVGNRVIVVPSPVSPLMATDLYQVLETSDVPAGVVNIVPGSRDELAEVLAKHDEVAALWYFGPAAGSTLVERASVGNLKAIWTNYGKRRDWLNPKQGQGEEYVRRATQIKNIWVPYGE